LSATRVQSHLSPAGAYQERFNGVTAYRALKQTALDYQNEEESLLIMLEQMAAILLNRTNLIISFTGEAQEIERFKSVGATIVDSLAETKPAAQPQPQTDFARSEAFITAAEIVFAVQGGTLFDSPASYNGSFEVLKTYLSRDYLWNNVRQIGGAYGCFIQFSPITGNMTMISYRDPQVRKTFNTYDQVPLAVSRIELSKAALDQLVIGTYGNFDPHQSAAAKAVTARNEFLCNITAEQKQQRLKEISSTTVEDLRSFADRLEAMTRDCYRAIIGNRAKIEADGDLFEVISDL
ncbi:MAG: peptidase M16, partial [Desulfofustis sp.]